MLRLKIVNVGALTQKLITIIIWYFIYILLANSGIAYSLHLMLISVLIILLILETFLFKSSLFHNSIVFRKNKIILKSMLSLLDDVEIYPDDIQKVSLNNNFLVFKLYRNNPKSIILREELFYLLERNTDKINKALTIVKKMRF